MQVYAYTQMVKQEHVKIIEKELRKRGSKLQRQWASPKTIH